MSVPVLPVYLDRDGVINENRDDYVRSLEQWVPLPGSLDAIARLCSAGHPVVVVTNQSAVARGYCSVEDVGAIHGRLQNLLEELDAHLTGLYYCPHHPDDRCSCRKPATGMIQRARSDSSLPAGGWMVGDAASDMEMGANAGLVTVLVLTGRGEAQLERMKKASCGMPDHVVRDLAEAVDLILGE